MSDASYTSRTGDAKDMDFGEDGWIITQHYGGTSNDIAFVRTETAAEAVMAELDPEDIKRVRRNVWTYRHIVANLICEVFDLMELRGKPDKALVVHFRTAERTKSIDLYLWTPMSYVGVFKADLDLVPGEFAMGGLNCLMYHDSCWRNGVEDFVRNHEDVIEGLGLERIRVEKVSDELAARFKAARRTAEGRD